MNKDSKQQ